MDKFETIVVGLGAMGSAALYQLAKKGRKALGIDLLSPPHNMGSSHGGTRITRQAIGEGEQYTPLSLRSYELFRELERITGESLLTITGGLIISSDADNKSKIHVPEFFENTLAAARKYNIRHEMLDAGEIRKRFPQFNVKDNEFAYYEYEAGYLRPEEIITASLKVAQAQGASVHTNEKLIDFAEESSCVKVRTDKATYMAENLILTVGPWLPQILCDLGSVFKVYRQTVFWFDVEEAIKQFSPPNFPIFIWQIQGSDNGVYGFPAVDGKSFKIGNVEYAEIVTPDSVNREVSRQEEEEMYAMKVAPFFPLAKNKCLKSAVCLYTVTEDCSFAIDWLPSSKRVLLGSACSGHGFKHASAIGEGLADLATSGETRPEIAPFKLERLLCAQNS